MDRLRRMGALVLCAALLAAPAAAGDGLADGIRARLTAQGFTGIEIGHTLLGRLQIAATGHGYRREIVIDPASGEVLRDYWQSLADGRGVVHLAGPDDALGGDRDHDGPDDDDDDDDDDDQPDDDDD